MIDAILGKIFGTKHERDVKRMMPTDEATNALEPAVQALGDAELRAKPDELRKRLAAGQSVDALLTEAYRADVTYGTNNEFGFDYLRDNMRFTLDELVQRALHYAIVDEVDSILIDEARTPLIISGPADESTELYYKLDRIIPKLKRAA